MAIRPFKAGPNVGKTAHDSDVAPEGASQTFKIGAILINSSGNLIEASADPSSGILAVADEDGENGSAGVKHVRFTPARDTVFEGTLTDGSSYALVVGDLWKKYGVAKDGSTGFWYIDQTETSTKVVQIVGFRDAVGTADARVYFIFLDAVLDNAS